MTRLFSLIGASIGGAIGWAVGAKVGIMTAFMLSVLGTGFGMYYATRLARQYLP